jgi:uncharacterized membrane protein YfcA
MIDFGLFVVGIVVGGMNAIAGGGMLIGFPILLAVGLPALVANATAAIITLPGQISSAYGYRKFLRKVPKSYLWLLVPCAAGAFMGATLLRNTSSKRFAELVPALILLAVVLFALQPFIKLQLHRHLHGKVKNLRPLLIIGISLFPLSIYGGYFGAGFGFVMLALLSFTKLHDLHQINGMKNLGAVAIAGTSVVTLYTSGLIDWHHGLVMAVGSLLGGYYGSRAAQKVSSHALRIVVIVIGIVTTIYLAFRTY